MTETREELLDRYPPAELELALRPPGWDPFEELTCPVCHGNGRIEVLRRGRLVLGVCRVCMGAKRLMVGEPAESAYCLILDYTQPQETTP